MNKTTKIIFSVGVPLAIFGFYWFIYRNREPLLNLEETDWLDNMVTIKFGNNNKSVALGDSGEMNAGSTYNSNLFKLTFKTDKKLMIFYVKDKDGNLIDKQTLDFGAKIRY
jgi:hypothetical protein